MPSKRAGLAIAALVLGNFALALGPWLVRMSAIAPAASAFWRIMIALPLLFLVARLSGQPMPRAGRSWILLAIGGALFALDLVAWHSGIVVTRLANATMFGNIASFFFAAYGFIVVRKFPEARQWIAIALAFAGMILLLGRSYHLDLRYLIGDLLCLLGGLFYAGYLIVMDKARGRMASWPALAIASLCALPLLFGYAVSTGPIMPEHWTPLILLAIGSQVIGQGMLVFAVGHLSPLLVGIGLLAQPAVGAVIGATMYGERLGLADFAGMAAIGIALVLIRAQQADR